MKFTLEIELGNDGANEMQTYGEIAEAIRTMLVGENAEDTGIGACADDFGRIRNPHGENIGSWEVTDLWQT